MSRYVIVGLLVFGACEQENTAFDAGSVCTISDTSDAFLTPGEATIEVGQPIPLLLFMPVGPSTQVDSAECFVEMQGNEAFITSIVQTTTPGRLPWANENSILRFTTAECEMPPSTEGVTRIVYGENSMAITVPGTTDRCVPGQTWDPNE